MPAVPTASARGTVIIPRGVVVALGLMLVLGSLQGVVGAVQRLAGAEREVLRDAVATSEWRDGSLAVGTVVVVRGDDFRLDVCPVAGATASLRVVATPTAGGAPAEHVLDAAGAAARACLGARWKAPATGTWRVDVRATGSPPALRRASLYAGPGVDLRAAWPLVALLLGLALAILAPKLSAPPAHASTPPARPPVERSWGIVGLAAGFVASLALPFAVHRALGPGPVTPLLTLLAQHGAFALSAAALLGGPTRAAMGFEAPPARWLLRAFPIALALIAVAIGTSARITDTSESPLAQELASMPTRLTILYTALLAPVSEELFYRGAVQRAFRRGGDVGAVIVQAAVFTVLHAAQLRGARWGLLPIAAVGLVNGGLRVATGGLAVPWLVHTLYNAALIAAAFASPG